MGIKVVKTLLETVATLIDRGLPLEDALRRACPDSWMRRSQMQELIERAGSARMAAERCIEPEEYCEKELDNALEGGRMKVKSRRRAEHLIPKALQERKQGTEEYISALHALNLNRR
jgi:hypothetical protein